MAATHVEWLKQAEYDLESAKIMLDTGRYNFTLFMCHLSIEKALKGLFAKQTGEIPKKTHNLIYLINEIGLELPEKLENFIFDINQLAIFSRYPSDLDQLLKDYNQQVTQQIYVQSKEAIEWIKQKY